MSETTAVSAETVTSLRDLQAYNDWIGESNVAEAVRMDRHRSGPGVIDTNDVDQLLSRVTLLQAATDEREAREHLALEVADRQYDGLDIVGKLATLFALSNVDPSSSPNGSKVFVDISRDESIVRYGIQGTLKTTEVIRELDRSLREVDEALHDGSQVDVEEKHNWLRGSWNWEKDRPIEPGDLPDSGTEVFASVVRTEGTVPSRHRSFMLWHPVVSEDGKVVYQIPSGLASVNKWATRHIIAPDVFERKRPDASHIKYDPQTRITYIPLPGLMRALGRNVDHLDFDSEYSTRTALTIVKIDGTELTSMFS